VSNVPAIPLLTQVGICARKSPPQLASQKTTGHPYKHKGHNLYQVCDIYASSS
jgi:hypothetical protein